MYKNELIVYPNNQKKKTYKLISVPIDSFGV